MFCRQDGSPLDPDDFSKAFKRRARAAGLPPIGCTTFRHGLATLWLRAGVHPKVVQEGLGQHSAAFTLDAYGHVTAGLQEHATAKRHVDLFSMRERAKVLARVS